MSRSCDNCGAEVLAKARFCDNCGMPVSSKAAASQEEKASTRQTSPSAQLPPHLSSLALSTPPPSSTPPLPPPSPLRPPPVDQSPASVSHPTPAAEYEEDERISGRFRVTILGLLLLLIVLLGGTAYALTRGTSEDVVVPDLVGAPSVSDAQRMAGGDFEVVADGHVESREPLGTVLSQDRVAGEMADEGSSIFVNVSKGAKLPDVRGQTREEARRILEEAGFEVEEKTEESSAGDKGYATEQDPQGGTGVTAETGSSVTITVGEGPANEPSPKAKSSAPKQTPPPSVEKKVEEPEPKPPPAEKKAEEPKPKPPPEEKKVEEPNLKSSPRPTDETPPPTDEAPPPTDEIPPPTDEKVEGGEETTTEGGEETTTEGGEETTTEGGEETTTESGEETTTEGGEVTAEGGGETAEGGGEKVGEEQPASK